MLNPGERFLSPSHTFSWVFVLFKMELGEIVKDEKVDEKKKNEIQQYVKKQDFSKMLKGE